MARQGELTGIERKKIPELEDKAEVYAKSMKKRVNAGVAEKADKAALIEAMRTHKLKSYRTDDGMIITISEGTAKVQISEADEAPSDDGEEEKGADKAN